MVVNLETLVMLFVISGVNTLRRAAPGEGSALETDCSATRDASRKAADFFTCFGYNPLKSIDSAKEIQINPRVFIWFSLDFLAMDRALVVGTRATRSSDAPRYYRRSHSRFIDAAGLA